MILKSMHQVMLTCFI